MTTYMTNFSNKTEDYLRKLMTKRIYQDQF